MKKEQLYRMRVYPIDTDANITEWAAEFPDLPGCVGAGVTVEGAVVMAMDAKKAWIETAIKEGRHIPKPKNIYDEGFSGKFTLRLPKTLHKELTIQAEEEKVSLNQYILYLITNGFSKTALSKTNSFREHRIISIARSSFKENKNNVKAKGLKVTNYNFSCKDEPKNKSYEE